MKKRTLFLGALGAAVFTLTADAQSFNPVPLTPGSFTQDIIVETNYANFLQATNLYLGGLTLNYGLTATVGGGTGLGDNTFYERGLRIGQFNGMPTNGQTFTHLSKPGIQYVMAPDYKVPNTMMIDSGNTGGTLTLVTPTTATNLSFLGTGGGGSATVNYTVNHVSGSPETGTITYVDWFNGANYAWTNSGRITVNGGFNDTGNGSGNPRVYSSEITVSSASPVTSIDFTYNTGQHANIFAVSGSASGGTWTPMPVSGFNHKVIVPITALPYPVNATMDQGTNLAWTGNLATWFEKGLAGASFPDSGLPHPGENLTNVNFPTHVFQMAASYTANNSILIDTNHQTVNITPANPTNYTAFALLTGGGNIGTLATSIMTNVIILQHADGMNETNLFFGYDWFATNSQIAYVTGGRINLASRSINSQANPVTLVNNPKLFESTFGLANTTSPVTNIVLQFKTSPFVNSTTYVLAVSATAGAVAPVISSQTAFVNAYAGGIASFKVTLSAGSTPLTYIWQTNDVTLVNGGKVSGASTTNLVLTGVDATDGNFYSLIITNSAGAVTSAPILLTILSTNTDVTVPTDPITAVGPNVSANEGVINAISNTTSKYLNFGANNGSPFSGPAGFTVTPLGGGSIVTGLRVYAANDAIERDPSDYTLEGSTDGTNFTVISSGSLTLPGRRNAANLPLDPLTQSLAEVDFANITTNAVYRVTFNNVRDNSTANSMQVGEVELLGTFAGSAPFIVQDTTPSFILNFEGLISTLNVSASGPALTYQWRQNGVAVSGATNAAFAFATLPGTNFYNCIVANAFTPPATSSVATVVGVPSTLASTWVVNFHDAMGAQYAETQAAGDANLWTNVVYSGMGAYADLPANTNWNGFGLPDGYDPVFNSTTSPQRASDGSPTPVTLSTTYSFDSGALFYYGDNSTNNTCPTCPSYVLGLNAVAANGIPPGLFTLRNVPPGSYTLYVYCANVNNDRGSLFTINGSRQASCTNAVTGGMATSFVQDKNYIIFTNITPNANGTITGSYTGINNPISGLSGEGNFNGVQLIKLATSVPVLSITPSGGNVQISWTPGVGVLQSAPAVTGPYTDIPTATSPYSTPSAGVPQFYRIRL